MVTPNSISTLPSELATYLEYVLLIKLKVIANEDNKIESYINKDLVKININSSIEEAIKLMGSKKIKRLLVENNNKLVYFLIGLVIILLLKGNNNLIEKLGKLELNTVKEQALKELGFTTITEDNAKDVFEKIAEIQSRGA